MIHISHQPLDTPMGAPRRVPYVYIVVGDGDRAGTIKSVAFRKECSCHFLNVEMVSTGWDISIAATYKRKGWRLLDDLYDEDPDLKATVKNRDGSTVTFDRDQCRKRFHDFQDHLRGKGADMVDKAYHKCIVPGFPDEMLPMAVRDLERKRNPLTGVYDPIAGGVIDRTVEPEPKPAKPSSSSSGKAKTQAASA